MRKRLLTGAFVATVGVAFLVQMLPLKTTDAAPIIAAIIMIAISITYQIGIRVGQRNPEI